MIQHRCERSLHRAPAQHQTAVQDDHSSRRQKAVSLRKLLQVVEVCPFRPDAEESHDSDSLILELTHERHFSHQLGKSRHTAANVEHCVVSPACLVEYPVLDPLLGVLDAPRRRVQRVRKDCREAVAPVLLVRVPHFD